MKSFHERILRLAAVCLAVRVEVTLCRSIAIFDLDRVFDGQEFGYKIAKTSQHLELLLISEFDQANGSQSTRWYRCLRHHTLGIIPNREDWTIDLSQYSSN